MSYCHTRRGHPAALRDLDEDRQPARAWPAQPPGRAAGEARRPAPRALSAAMVLRRLQSLLGRLYDVIVRLRRLRFPGHRPARSRGCDPGQRPARARRGAAARGDGGRRREWRCTSTRACSCASSRRIRSARLTEANLADYCTALEGVSHFLYSTWRLNWDAPVSLLELETQAEVDKYAATVFLVADQQGGGLSGAGACAAVRPDQFRCSVSSRNNTTATGPRTAARRIFAGGWRAGS